MKLNKNLSPEVVGVVSSIEDYGKLADTIASHIARARSPTGRRSSRYTTVTGRLEKVFVLMENQISVLQVEKRIRAARQAPRWRSRSVSTTSASR